MEPYIEVRILAPESAGPLAQRQSDRLITGWSQVRILQGPLDELGDGLPPGDGGGKEGRTMNHVLVLNATYEPLNVVSVRRAVLLLLKEKAEIVEAAEAWLRSEQLALPVPLVIRLVYYVRIPRRISSTCLSPDRAGPRPLHLPVLRRPARQGPISPSITCCLVLEGARLAGSNVVTACGPCNRRKGNRTPDEARMPLRRQPRRPRYLAFTLLEGASAPKVWNKYMYF